MAPQTEMSKESFQHALESFWFRIETSLDWEATARSQDLWTAALKDHEAQCPAIGHHFSIAGMYRHAKLRHGDDPETYRVIKKKLLAVS